MSFSSTLTVIDEQTVLRTYNHEKLNLPFRVQVKRVLQPNAQMGAAFAFEVAELNLRVEKTISEAQLAGALNYFGTDIGELSQQLFAGQDDFVNSQEQFDRVMMFSNANLEYKQWQIANNGLSEDEVPEENWIQFLLSDFCFFMADAVVQLYLAGRQNVEQ